MKGVMLTLKCNEEATIIELDKYPDHTVIHDAVGGYLELVPYFDTIVWDGELHQCIAFCDEYGKVKKDPSPLNHMANIYWKLAQKRSGKWVDDVLVGNIVVIWGDQELMHEL